METERTDQRLPDAQRLIMGATAVGSHEAALHMEKKEKAPQAMRQEKLGLVQNQFSSERVRFIGL